jgi:hypothetical protein
MCAGGAQVELQRERCVPKVLKLSSEVSECKPLRAGRAASTRRSSRGSGKSSGPTLRAPAPPAPSISSEGVRRRDGGWGTGVAAAAGVRYHVGVIVTSYYHNRNCAQNETNRSDQSQANDPACRRFARARLRRRCQCGRCRPDLPQNEKSLSDSEDENWNHMEKGREMQERM